MIVQIVLLSFSSVDIFPMPSKSDNNSNRDYVLGYKYVLGPSQNSLIFNINPHVAARAKMSLSRAQNIFMPANINSIVLLF